MTLRHLAPAPLLAVAILACTPSVPSNPNTSIVTAEFDPATSTIPLPNSLAISPELNPNLLAPRNAQEELLAYFAKQGGFPPDQVLSLEFPIATLQVNGPGDVTSTPPDIDSRVDRPLHRTADAGELQPVRLRRVRVARRGVPRVLLRVLGGSTGSAARHAVGDARHRHRADHLAPGRPLLLRAARRHERNQDHDRDPAAALLHHLHAHLRPGERLQLPLHLAELLAEERSRPSRPSTSRSSGSSRARASRSGRRWWWARSRSPRPPPGWSPIPGAGVVPIPSNFLLDPLTNKVSAAVDRLVGLPMSSLDGFSTTGMDTAQTSGPISAGSVRSSTGKGVYLYKAGATSATEVQTVYFQPPPITLDPGTGQPCAPVNAQGDFGPTCVATADRHPAGAHAAHRRRAGRAPAARGEDRIRRHRDQQGHRSRGEPALQHHPRADAALHPPPLHPLPGLRGLAHHRDLRAPGRLRPAGLPPREHAAPPPARRQPGGHRSRDRQGRHRDALHLPDPEHHRRRPPARGGPLREEPRHRRATPSPTRPTSIPRTPPTRSIRGRSRPPPWR